MAQSRRRFWAADRGNVAIIFAFSLPVLVVFAGLGTEAGYWYFRHREVQTAADVAAYAGAVSLRNDEPAAQARQETAAEAERHGYYPGLGSIETNTPPRSGAYVNERAMEVIISQETPRFFSQLITSEPMVIGVRSVAAYEKPHPGCILALDYEESSAVEFFGSSDMSLLNCEVMSNSIASDAVEVRGQADVTTPCMNSVGGFHRGGASSDVTLTDCPKPRVDLPRAPDPYEDVPEPDTSVPCENLEPGETEISTSGGTRRFCGGLDLNNDDFNFAPGVYVVDGGTFSIDGQSNVTGDGVTFYLTGGAEIEFNGTASIDITAPTSGVYAGIAFFGDRGDYGAQHTFNGTANSSITGAMYFPAGDIYFLGDFSGDNGCMQLVGRTVHVGGNVDMQTDCSGVGLKWAEVPSDVRLVE